MARQTDDDPLPVLLLLAAIGGYLYLTPSALAVVQGWLAQLPDVAAVDTTVQQALTTAETWLVQEVPALASYVTPAAAVDPVPAIVPVVIGATGAALSDLELAHLLEQLTLSVVQNGGHVITALNIADLGEVLQIVGTVGLVIDMVFTILGDASDAQKAFDVALDAVMIAALWIPVYGWAIALVVGLIKIIGDMFGFSQGLTHAQREALERAAYGAQLAPMLADLAHAFSPREMLRVLIAWGTGYCGGVHTVAMAAQLRDGSGGICPLVSVPCYQWAQFAGTVYRGYTLPAGGVSLDQQALWLVQYGMVDLTAEAQVGIREDLKTIFNEQIVARVHAKLPYWQGILQHDGTLDTLDVVAAEIRLTPDLNALATYYGWGTWKAGLAAMLQPQWTAYRAAHPDSSTLSGFAQAYGYPDLRTWRTALFAPLWSAWQRWQQVIDGCADAVFRAPYINPPAS